MYSTVFGTGFHCNSFCFAFLKSIFRITKFMYIKGGNKNMSKHLSDFRKSMSCSSNVNPIQVQKAESRWKDELLIFKSAIVGTISGDITFRNKEDMYELVEIGRAHV